MCAELKRRCRAAWMFALLFAPLPLYPVTQCRTILSRVIWNQSWHHYPTAFLWHPKRLLSRTGASNQPWAWIGSGLCKGHKNSRPDWRQSTCHESQTQRARNHGQEVSAAGQTRWGHLHQTSLTQGKSSIVLAGVCNNKFVLTTARDFLWAWVFRFWDSYTWGITVTSHIRAFVLIF